MSEATDLISGDALKAAAQRFLGEVRAKIDQEQGGLLSIFDSWFSRVLTKLSSLDRERPWEESVNAHAAKIPGPAQDLQWDLNRLRLFLDRWEQGRFVEFSRRERSAAHHHSRFGTEFGADVLLTCQGAPSLMRWRGKPLMKNVFDFAIYPVLSAELRPRTVFEIGSGSGASAAWFADLLALSGPDGRVHSVDIAEVQMQHPRVHFYKGDCSSPDALFPGIICKPRRIRGSWWRMLITMSQVCSICCTTFSSPATIWSSRTATSNATQFAHSSMRIPETISSIRASPTISDETQPARLIQSL
jgi:Rhamnosyl O-methyltransferase/CmcI